MKRLTFFQWLSLALLLVGGVNWGLVGFFNFDLVAAIFGAGSLLARTIYAVVGLGAIYGIFMTARLVDESYCMTMPSMKMGEMKK